MDNTVECAPTRCGCRVPLVFDRSTGCWRHLDDLSRCDPHQPRSANSLAAHRLALALRAQAIAYLRTAPERAHAP